MSADWSHLPPGQASTATAAAPLLYGSANQQTYQAIAVPPTSSASSPGAGQVPYRSMDDHDVGMSGATSSVSPPSESKLWSLDIPNTFGVPYAKDWLWMTRDQIGLGIVHYPNFCWFWRFLSFLSYVFCCGCLCARKTCDDKIQVISESSFLLFTSRVDYMTIHAFTAPQEKLRFYLPACWFVTVDKLPGFLGACVNVGMTILLFFVRCICWAWEWFWATEFGAVFCMLFLIVGSFVHCCFATGINGEPDMFAAGIGIFFFTVLVFICAVMWHCSNRSYKDLPAPTPIQKIQSDRWTVVSVLYFLIALFFFIAAVAGIVFLRHQYPIGSVSHWNSQDNLMCYDWDETEGHIKPYPAPEPPLPPAAPITGPLPNAPTLVSVVTDATFADVLFVAPYPIDNISPWAIIGYNGTAFGADLSVTPFPFLPTVGTTNAQGETINVVGVRFSPLKTGMLYTLQIQAQSTLGYSPVLEVKTTPTDKCPTAPPPVTCTVPPVQPTIASVQPGNPGDGLGFVTILPPPVGNTPAIIYYSVYQYDPIFPQNSFILNITSDISKPLQVSVNLFDMYVGFAVTATNLVGESTQPQAQLNPAITYQIFQTSRPSGISNMCDKVNRSTLIAFMFAIACSALLLLLLCYFTCICFPRRTYAKLMLHGRAEWGFPISVLLDVNDARQIESQFTAISKGQYAAASQNYAQMHRINSKLD